MRFLTAFLVAIVGISRPVCGAEIVASAITPEIQQISVSGNIQPGDEMTFLAASVGTIRALVFFSSNGGNLVAGLEIGRIIRRRGFSTTVQDGNTCASACALAWLGGTTRFLGPTSSIGFHAAYNINRGEAATSSVGNALIGSYLANLGLPDRAIVYITVAQPNEMTWLNVPQARARGIDVSLLAVGPSAPRDPAPPQERQAAVSSVPSPSVNPPPTPERTPTPTPIPAPAPAIVPAPRPTTGPARTRPPGFPVPIGQVFRDCGHCPEMVPIPAGQFIMGSAVSDPGRELSETPQRTVTLANPIAVGRFPVTHGEFSAFTNATGWQYSGQCWRIGYNEFQERDWDEHNFDASAISVADGEPTHPVICISWDDAMAYAAWLTRTTGKNYRLLTEAEWEYAARGGTTSRYWWGNDDRRACEFGNLADATASTTLQQDGWHFNVCHDNFIFTSPVGNFPANRFGLHDMSGNVWQWVLDCFRDNYNGAPVTASRPVTFPGCTRRVLRGGSWADVATDLRVAAREASFHLDRRTTDGFRVARMP